jgi:hypothetical protein
MLAVALAVAAPAAVRAQGKLEAQYTVTLAGIPIGKGNWVVDISSTHYMAAASGVTTGLVHAFTGGHGTSVAHGTLAAGHPQNATYASTIVTRSKTDEVRLTVNKGIATDFTVDPPPDMDPERLPITDQHRHGILDPMTASLMPTPGEGDPVSPEACQRTLAIFDGRMRYNLQLTFKRMEHVKAAKGYDGPAVVCAVYFAPLAGYVPTRAAVRYLARLRDLEVWLAPIAGTRVLVPFRAQGPTPIGNVVLQATQFVSSVVPGRASVNGLKTQ